MFVIPVSYTHLDVYKRQQYDVRVIYGLDAHAPQKYSDRTCYDIVNQEIIYDLPLTFVEDLSFDKKI